MTLYAYVVTIDAGFAPNPYWGVCTLATCKPEIRRRAQVGDWVIGTGSVRNVGPGRLIFAMRVDEVLTFDEYDRDPRFWRKRPNLDSMGPERCGDSIYYRGSGGHWRIRPSYHRHAQMTHDLAGRHVLVSRRFYYWGAKAPRIPARFKALVPTGRGHRSRFDPALVARFVAWLAGGFRPGRLGLLHRRATRSREGSEGAAFALTSSVCTELVATWKAEIKVGEYAFWEPARTGVSLQRVHILEPAYRA